MLCAAGRVLQIEEAEEQSSRDESLKLETCFL